MQMFRPHSRPTESDSLVWVSKICLNKPSSRLWSETVGSKAPVFLSMVAHTHLSNFFKIPMAGLLSRSMNLGSLGVEPKCQCFLKLCGWLQCEVQVKGHCCPSAEPEYAGVRPGVFLGFFVYFFFQPRSPVILLLTKVWRPLLRNNFFI